MNIKRWTSALLGFPLIAAVLIFGNRVVVDIALAVFAFIALNEYFNCIKEKANPIYEVGYASTILIALAHVIKPEIWIMIIPVILLALFLKVILTKMKVTIHDVAYTLFGMLYIVGLMMFVSIVNGCEHGKVLIWYVFFASWGTDIFAYLTGKFMGKHKFTEISPKKSIEGCIGGILGAIVLMLIYTVFINQYFDMHISYGYIVVISIILSIVGQIGDLSASTIKRFGGIKDFSNLIPGHGGILDRMDSVIFVAPFVYLFLVILV